jgi:hypothetical protein
VILLGAVFAVIAAGLLVLGMWASWLWLVFVAMAAALAAGVLIVVSALPSRGRRT